MADYRKNPSPLKGGTGGLPAVTPKEVDRVRRSVLDVVRKNIYNVREVLDGKKTWSNQQVRLFGMMLNKVMPDLHHSFNQHSIENKDPNELTLAELEAIASSALYPEASPGHEDDYDIEDADIIDEEDTPDEPDTEGSRPASPADPQSANQL
jgi:hypothetical protein